MRNKKALIIGAGPAGLVAAYELIKKSDIVPIILESDKQVGGISKTINFNGNLVDIGPHRFFSKSKDVNNLWKSLLCVQGKPSWDDLILCREFKENGSSGDPEEKDDVFLVRNRLTRIFFLKKFFNYPINFSKNTMKNLGLKRIAKVLVSYLSIKIKPIKQENSLEDFYINRFGRELYNTFFKDYTKKVWGVDCNNIAPDWGSQRVKGVSVKEIIKDAFSKNKNKHTSLIDSFYYPKYGAGQMWERIREVVEDRGGQVLLSSKVTRVNLQGDVIKSLEYKKNGVSKKIKCDYCLSSMPIYDLIRAMGSKVPREVKNVSNGLVYRDIVNVYFELKDLKLKNNTSIKTIKNIIPDNWIYIQESDVKVGRLTIYNNMSPYLSANKINIVIGMEFYCYKKDSFWNKKDKDIINLAKNELKKIGVIFGREVVDSFVFRQEKAYPAYFGTYADFGLVEEYLNSIKNIYPIGRNGMHKYNNMDHSVLSAIEAVDCIINKKDKKKVWNVNAEKDYHEEKQQKVSGY